MSKDQETCKHGHDMRIHAVWIQTAQGLKRRCRECNNAARRKK